MCQQNRWCLHQYEVVQVAAHILQQLLFLAVKAGRHSGYFFENIAEISCRTEMQVQCDACDTFVGKCQQNLGTLHARAVDIGADTIAGFLLKQT